MYSVSMLEGCSATKIKIVPVAKDPERKRVSLTVFPFRHNCHEGFNPLAPRQGLCHWLGVGRGPPLQLLSQATNAFGFAFGFASCFFLCLMGKRHLSSARDNPPFWAADAGFTSLVTRLLSTCQC